MKILAIEFSSEQRSVAIVEKQSEAISLVKGFAVEAGGRNTHAIGLVEEALRHARLEREQIDCIAVGIGPGSYTGIRSAIAFAQGWQLGRDVKLIGIGSIECLASQAFAMGVRGHGNFIVDAQRNEFYLAGYRFDEKEFVEVEPLHLATAAEVESKITDRQMVFGPEASQRFPTATSLMPDASALGALACGKTNFGSGEKLEPVYLREISFVKAPPPRAILDR